MSDEGPQMPSHRLRASVVLIYNCEACTSNCCQLRKCTFCLINDQILEIILGSLGDITWKNFPKNFVYSNKPKWAKQSLNEMAERVMERVPLLQCICLAFFLVSSDFLAWTTCWMHIPTWLSIVKGLDPTGRKR